MKPLRIKVLADLILNLESDINEHKAGCFDAYETIIL